jgi:hypothetical protein
MESSTTGGDPYRRYEGIEKAYCEGRWDTVLEAGTVLLRELPEAEDDAEIKGLRHRLHLLMAHTLLHGYGDRDAAEDLYTLVQHSDAESSLRQMAEDGLDQCHRPLSSTFVAEDLEEEAESHDRPTLFLPESEDGAADDLAKAPERARSVPVIALRQPPAPPSESQPEEEPKPVDGALVTPGEAKRDEEGSADPGLAADPFQPPHGSPVAETLTIGLPVMPWRTTAESPAEEEPTPQVSTGAQAGLPATPPLIPEVVEEPELIEIHQANPSLAEEVELVTSRRERPPARNAREAFHPPEATVEDEMEDLRSSLLMVKLG